MSIVVAIPVKQSSGEQITEFISVVANDLTTWTYTTPQNHITVKNLGVEPITVTINAENITVNVGESVSRSVTITEISAITVDANSPLTNQINVVSIIDPPLPDVGPITWADVTGKPSTYPPTIGVTAVTAKAGNYVPAWSEVTGKPTTFSPPAATAATIGGVKQAAHVDPASGTVTDVVNALIAAGQMA